MSVFRERVISAKLREPPADVFERALAAVFMVRFRVLFDTCLVCPVVLVGSYGRIGYRLLQTNGGNCDAPPY